MSALFANKYRTATIAALITITAIAFLSGLEIGRQTAPHGKMHIYPGTVMDGYVELSNVEIIAPPNYTYQRRGDPCDRYFATGKIVQSSCQASATKTYGTKINARLNSVPQ